MKIVCIVRYAWIDRLCANTGEREGRYSADLIVWNLSQQLSDVDADNNDDDSNSDKERSSCHFHWRLSDITSTSLL